MILPLIDQNFISDAYILIHAEAPYNEKLVKFFYFLLDTWVDDNTKYAHSIWSHGDNYSLRTINNLESWHRRLNDNVNG